MAQAWLQPVDEKAAIEKKIKHIMDNIKSLQRELIKASFKQSNATGSYSELLKTINNERAKVKLLNQRLSQTS